MSWTDNDPNVPFNEINTQKERGSGLFLLSSKPSRSSNLQPAEINKHYPFSLSMGLNLHT